MIDPLSEALVTPAQATRYFPRGPGGRTLHVSGIYRFMKCGVRGIVLESLRTPRLVTSREAIARFLARLNGQESAQPRPPRASRGGRQAPDLIGRELDRLGF